jgi:DNA-binding winged helix-turn-helix (wHTH) protein/tetratricopeptide (TPR) repeat protein
MEQAPTPHLLKFGPYVVDLASGELRKNGHRIRLQENPLRVLALLAEKQGQLATREELRKRLWPEDTFVDFENGLNAAVSKLRDALSDSAENSRYIETIPRRGYRFLFPVEVIPANGNGITSPAVTATDTELTSGRIDANAAVAQGLVTRKRSGIRGKLLYGSLVAIVILAFVGGWFRIKPKIADRDTIVLADFDNKTGESVFDDTLKTALTVSLRQSPFLSVLSDSQVAKTLQQMTRPASTKLTPEVARELCQRAGSKAYIAGSIGTLGSKYVLGLKAVSCQSGETQAEEQVMAASKEKVLDALGEAASKLRSGLGESLATVQKFDVPLSQATTSSLEALKAYSLAEKENGVTASLPYYQRAIELDPNFAMGYRALGGDYLSLSEVERGRVYLTKAFELREHASELEKLTITANYYEYVTGEMEKAQGTFQEEIASYPREFFANGDLSFVFAAQGQYERAAEIARRGVRFAPDSKDSYENLASYCFALQRFDEAQQIIHEAQKRKLDDYGLHVDLYILGFLTSDSSTMAEQRQWFAGKPDYENYGLALASDTEAYGGHLSKSRELTKRAVDSAVRADNKETGADYLANAALQQAAYGNPAEARKLAVGALKFAPTSQVVGAEAALAFAMAGNTARAVALAKDLGKRFPLDMQMQALWLPAIQAQVALNRKNPSVALNAPQAVSPIELGIILNGSTTCLYHVYIRGEVELEAGQGDAAAAEFQKILDHTGIIGNCWTGALARLGVARAKALEVRTLLGTDADSARARALASYRDFLTLWKDADPDIPILNQAKTEYAKLQ